MKIGILGSGSVGVALAHGFIAEGHSVYIATRDPKSDKADKLTSELESVEVTDFVSAAKESELIVLCVHSSAVEDAISLAGADNLASKIVIDTSNGIKKESDMLVYDGGDQSIAESIQAYLKDSKVVKAFNTVGAALMYKPDFSDHTSTMLMAANDIDAKAQVSDIVTSFGWNPLDTGPLPASRALEQMALIWINNAMSSGSSHHAFKML